VEEFVYRGKDLVCESAVLRPVAEKYGTPLYVYSKRSLLDHCRHIERAFEGHEHSTYFAVKANANAELLRLIAREGLGADVVSRGELYLALAAGFRPEKITFSGVGKRDDEIAYALHEKIFAFDVESTEEIEVLNGIAGREGSTARILLRVNLDIEAGSHPYIATSTKESKFGIRRDQALEVFRWAGGLPHVAIGGVHSHIGSQITRVETFQQAARSIVALVRELREAGIEVHEVDFGGGFGVQYRGYVNDPRLPREEPEEVNLSASTLILTTLPLLRETGCRLSIQPGRSVIAHAAVLLVKVLFRKEAGGRTFVVVDGGMNDLIRPSLYNAHHQIVPLELRGTAHEKADVVGPLCESGDFFARERMIPRVERGEYLALMCTGAYGYALSSNYNARPRPAEVLVEGDATRLIRKRETIEALLSD